MFSDQVYFRSENKKVFELFKAIILKEDLFAVFDDNLINKLKRRSILIESEYSDFPQLNESGKAKNSSYELLISENFIDIVNTQKVSLKNMRNLFLINDLKNYLKGLCDIKSESFKNNYSEEILSEIYREGETQSFDIKRINKADGSLIKKIDFRDPNSFLEDPILGVLHKVKNINFGDLYISLGYRKSPIIVQGEIYDDFGSVGKSFDQKSARRNCMAEAVERYCTYFDKELFQDFRCKSSELEGNYILEDFSNNVTEERLSWTWFQQIDVDEKVLLPSQVAFYSKYFKKNEKVFWSSYSAGSAAHLNLNDAIESALLECVERDALAIWWYNKLSMPRISECTIKDAESKLLIDEIKRNERDIVLLELVFDLSACCVVAITFDKYQEKLLFGASARFTRERAIKDALMEAAQMISMEKFTKIPDNGIGIIYHEYKVSDFNFLMGSEKNLSQDCNYELKDLLRSMNKASLKVFWKDISREFLPYKVARVVVPGICSNLSSKKSKRLFETPVKLGLLDTQYEQHSCNQVRLFV